MRLFVFFDLPNSEYAEGVAYRRFRRFLIKNGFVKNQLSVYSKFAINASQAELIKILVRKNLPECGNVQMLQVTERQFSEIEYLVGDKTTNVIDNASRWVVIE